MLLKNKVRVFTAAAMIATLGLVGCGKAPVGMPVGMLESDEFDALSKPVNQDAVGFARKWQADATQIGTMVNRSPKGVQDQATYAFTSSRDKDHMLLVIAANGGLQSRMINISDRTADGVRGVLPMSSQQSKMLNSKKIFKAAEQAGLKNAEDTIVMNTRTENGVEPMALVIDESGKHFMVLNAATGAPITGVQSSGMRKVQMHIIVIAAVVAVGAAVAAGIAMWRKRQDPKPKPTAQPSGHPTAEPTLPPTPPPAPSAAPTSKPVTDVGKLLVGPFGDMFDRLDADKDGALTLAEYLRPAPDPTTIKVKTDEFQVFLDPRHAGKINRATFLNGIEKSIANKCSMSFSMLDSNQDQGLDAQELNGELQPHEIGAADTNKDGRLSQAEFLVPFAVREGTFANYYK